MFDQSPVIRGRKLVNALRNVCLLGDLTNFFALLWTMLVLTTLLLFLLRRNNINNSWKTRVLNLIIACGPYNFCMRKLVVKILLCLYVPIKRNSTYLMLSPALDLENIFKRYSEVHPHYVTKLGEREGQGKPKLDDWDSVKSFSQFLASVLWVDFACFWVFICDF